MKYKGTIAVDEVNGSAGPVTGARAKGRKYLKMKPIPSNPRTEKQQDVRGSFAANSREFKALPFGDAQRWNEAATTVYGRAIFGEKAGMSGINLFQRVNQNISIAGGVNVTTPPTIDTTPFPALNILGLDIYNYVQYPTGTSANWAIVADEFTLPSGVAIIIRVTPVIVGNRVNVKSRLSILTNDVTVTLIPKATEGNLYGKDVSVISFGPAYPNRDLVPNLDQRIAVEVYFSDKNTGVTSPKYYFDGEIGEKIPVLAPES